MENQRDFVVLSEIVNNAAVDCIYADNEAWFTRAQIGKALEYEYPVDAIKKIHKRHKDRLDKFSRIDQIELPLGGFPDRRESSIGGGSVCPPSQLDARLKHNKSGQQDSAADIRGCQVDTPYMNQEVVLYNLDGVIEICRWSRQPKADMVMDALVGMAKIVMKQGYYSVISKEELHKLLGEQLKQDTSVYAQSMVPALIESELDMRDVLTQYTMALGYGDLPYRPSKKLSEFEEERTRRIRAIKLWEETEHNHFTYEDIPDWAKDRIKAKGLVSVQGQLVRSEHNRFPKIVKTLKRVPSWPKNFLEVNRRYHFNRAGYKQIIKYAREHHMISAQDFDRWKREAGLSSQKER